MSKKAILYDNIQDIANIHLDNKFKTLLFGKAGLYNIVKVKTKPSFIEWVMENKNGKILEVLQIQDNGTMSKMLFDKQGECEFIEIRRAIQILLYIHNKINE